MRISSVAAVMAVCLSVSVASSSLGQGVADRLGDVLDRRAPGLLAEFGEPGLAVAVVEECRPAWVRVYGVADRETDRPMTAETIVQVGSISKSLTAWAVMRLV